MANLWDALSNGANRVSGLLFPGMSAAGVDPQAAQLARAQAMMQMGAGLLGGQNFGQAYAAGQESGYAPMEQARRNEVMQADAQDRASSAAYRDWQMGRVNSSDKAAQDAAARQAEIQAKVAQYAANNDWEGGAKYLAGMMMVPQAEAFRALGQDPVAAEKAKQAFQLQLENVKYQHELGAIGARAKAAKDLATSQAGSAQTKPLTDAQAVSTGYLGRMQAAEKILDTTPYTPGFKDYMGFDSVISGGPLKAGIGNSMISSDGKKVLQAQMDWVRAKLRKESGAVIGPQEMLQEIRTYFPMPGDTQDVIDQKRAARMQATQALAVAAGPGVGRPDPLAPQGGRPDPLGLFQ